MIETLLAHISGFITTTISTLGYTGVALLMAIESAAIPLPSEIIMPFAGFLVASGRFSLFGLALAGSIGSTVGSLATYALGFYGGRTLIKKYGHYVFISEYDLDLTEKFFQRFGKWSTLLGRILPVIRTFISVPAGIGKVPVMSFAFFAFIGSFFWSYFLAWLGLKLGENWKVLEVYFKKFDLFIVALLVLGLVYWIRRHKRQTRQS